MKKIILIVGGFFLIVGLATFLYLSMGNKNEEINQEYYEFLISNGYTDIDGAGVPSKYFDINTNVISEDVAYNLFSILPNFYDVRVLDENKLGITVVFIPEEENIDMQYSLTVYLDNKDKVYFNDNKSMREKCIIPEFKIDNNKDELCQDDFKVYLDKYNLERALELIKSEYDLLNEFSSDK